MPGYKKVSKKKNPEADFAEKFRQEFMKDVEYRRQRHRIMNYCYLQYKGILYLNNVYGADYLRSVGLQVNVPRTFMTVEAIRPQLTGRPLDIDVKAEFKKGFPYRDKARDTIKGEWRRSKSDNAKADAEFDALVFGSGFFMSKYVEDVINTELYDGYDEEGKLKTTPGELTRYKGMKAIWLNPYYVFPDRTAITNEPGQSGSWGHCYVYSIWDFDVWKTYCEANDFNTDGMEKGGHLQEYDIVRRQIDSLYANASSSVRTRDDSGTLTQYNQRSEYPTMDMENKIGVIERFEEDSYAVCSGANWTVNHKGINTDPDKVIPIHVMRDYRIPGEFDGMGEPEVIRWQQYEENRVHNLSYMQVLMSTVQRYGIIESMLEDPTEASMSNPWKPIRLKYAPGSDVNKAIQVLNQGKGTNYPKDFLQEVKNIGQAATGITDFIIGASQAATDTATEANRLTQASNERIKQKIYEMEERDLVPVLEHWLACIPQYYTEELDFLLNDGEDYYAIFIPYTREFNDNPKIVADFATKHGVHSPDVTTVEGVFTAMGYKNVVFVSDIIQRFHIEFKTATATGDRAATVKILREVMMDFATVNKYRAEAQQPPKFDVGLLGEDILRQYGDIIKDPEEYIFEESVVPQSLPQGAQPAQVPAIPQPTAQPTIPMTV